MEDSKTETESKKQKESFSIFPKRKKVEKRGHKKKLPPSRRRECLVKGCPYRYDRNLQIKPYSLPEDPDLRALWVGFASLSGSVKIRARSGICKAHFREDQFNLSDLLKAKYGFINKEPRLKKNAVPTLLSEELKKRIQQSWTDGKERRNWKGVLESLNFAADKNSNMSKDAGVDITTQRPMPTPTRTPMPRQEIKPESTRGLFGENYHGLSVGDFCLPASAPKQEATWFEKKPSPEELAMASTDKAAITQDPPVLPVSLQIQSPQQQSISVMVKDEPISDSEESTFSTANPQQQAEEEIPSSQIWENTLPTIVTREDFQRNTSVLMASAPPPQEQTVRPLLQENAISTGEQASVQQSSQENAQSAMERHESGPENAVLKKILAMHQGMFPASSPKRIQIKKTDNGIVAVVFVPKDTKGPVAPVSGSTSVLKKPTILKTRMPTKIIKLAITKTQPSQPQPKHNKRKSEHLTKVVPEEEDEAEEGWEEIKDEGDVSRRESKRDTDEELDEEDEFRRAAETVEECAQSVLESDSDGGFDQGNDAEFEAAETVEECAQSVQDYDGGLDQGYDAEMEGAEQMNDIESDKEEEVREEEEEYEEEDDEEDFDEESFDDPNDSDYDPFQDVEKSVVKKKTQLGKPVMDLEGLSSDYSDSSFNTDEEDEKYPKKKKQKTRREWAKRYSLSGDERRKHNLKLQLAKSRRLRLECRLCKDNFFTIQKFQLHFEEKHPGEAEKLVTDLQLTLERKRIAFSEQMEKDVQERKKQMMLKTKKLEKKKQKKTIQEKKTQSEEIADWESQPRKSARLGLKKAKKVTDSTESTCDNYGNERQRLELYPSTSELELDSKASNISTNDQSNQGAYDASMKEAELQEENSTKAPTDMTVEETEPKRDKENEDTNTNTDITMQKTVALRDEVHEETKILMDSILQDIERREAENKDSITKTDINMQESDAQMDKENEDSKNPISATVRETYAPRENKHEETRNLMQENQSKNLNKNQESKTSGELQSAKSNRVEKSNVSIEHIGEHDLDLDNGCKNKQLSHSEPLETSVKTDSKTEAENTPLEGNKNSHSAFESSVSESTDTANLNKIVDGQAVEQDNEDQAGKLESKSEAEMQLDVRSQASADGGTVTNLSEPISYEPASEDGGLLWDKNAEVISEQEKVEFVPEDDEDVVFELDAWSNILLECTECSCYFEYRKYSSHLNEHEEEKKTNECERCGRRYLTEKNLHLHQKDCSGEPKGKKKRNFDHGVCEICGKYVNNVKQHLRVHKKDTFACKICNAMFQRKGHRDRHMLVHSSVKEYVCEICGRSFSQASNMRGHMRQHTQEKPYKCNMCEKSFVHNVSLKTHQKRDHGMDPWLGANTSTVGRRKKEQGDSSENKAKKRRTRKKETEECSSGETTVKRKRGRKKK